jgi:hypothetical protein
MAYSRLPPLRVEVTGQEAAATVAVHGEFGSLTRVDLGDRVIEVTAAGPQ